MNTDDLCKLCNTTEEKLVKVLQDRYLTNKIYTNAGLVLISINPYTNLDLYGINIMNAYFNSTSCDPHIYGVCESAYQDMIFSDQTILISGESGSGKTENTKLLQDYLIVRTGTNKDLKEKIEALTIILESFGNAKTALNDNSSRVGKMISYFINETIRGIKVNTFLLEKSRVTHQNKDESNFNIFYQLCTYKNINIKNDYIDTTNRKCNDYKNIKNALYNLGFSDVKFIENVLLVILYFGFMQFVYKNKKICIKDEKHVNFICQTLKIDQNLLESVLLKKEIKVNEELLVKFNTVEEAITIRDSISRSLYVKIFDFIVQNVNTTLNAPCGHCINILDIFGFEIFNQNSLDQLCINYANEKIQNDFIQKIFEKKQEEYKKELENYEFVPYASNSSLIYEMERRCGLFDLIDEESKSKFGNTDNLRTKIMSYIKKGIKFKSNDKLIVKHFVKDVEYDINNFITKNREVKIQKDIFKNVFNLSSNNTTVISSFFCSLKNLLQIINSTQVKYIRCIKPNECKSNSFDRKIVYNQLVNTGILEVIKINRQIFTYEMNKVEWYKKYLKYKKVIEGKTKVYFNTDVKIGIESVERLIDSRKNKVLEWFIRKLIDKKEGINKWFSNSDTGVEQEIVAIEQNINNKQLKESYSNLICEQSETIKEFVEDKSNINIFPNIEMCEIDGNLENSKKDGIKFNDQSKIKKLSTLEDMISDLFDENEDESLFLINSNKNMPEKESINEHIPTSSNNKHSIDIFNVEDTRCEDKTEDSKSSITEQIEIKSCDIENKDTAEQKEILISEINKQSVNDVIIDIDKITSEFHPVDVSEPIASVEVSEQIVPVEAPEPIASVEVIEPIAPVEAPEPVVPVEALEPIASVEVSEPIAPVEAPEPVVPVEAPESIALVEVLEPVVPVEASETVVDKHFPDDIPETLLIENNDNLKIENQQHDILYDRPNLDIVPSTSSCLNCENLNLKYKFVSEALKEANLRLSELNYGFLENASSLFSKLFFIYLDNIPVSESCPRSECLSFAHAAFLITRRSNKNIKEAVSVFTEEISLRLKFFERNIDHVVFFLSNLIEYSKLVGVNNDLNDLIHTLHVYLSEYYLDNLREYIPFSITEHQELSNFRCSDSFIKKIFKPVSPIKLIKTLDNIYSQLNFYYLDEDYKISILNFLLDNINTGIFNNLLIKKNFLNFNRCIQINYNLNKIFTWLRKISYVKGIDNFKHTLEVIKLVNFCASGDVKTDGVYKNFDLLTVAQINTFLIKMGFKSEDVKENVFITGKPLATEIRVNRIEENFVVPRYIDGSDLEFVFK
ncbi:myosin heavy chain [Vairimorpha ceranae]|uniref:Myosin heavy chain n=1 Tax=Vairimorpha ceranae TaxID=40302 RepID=A0A0F9WD83_9MICR|nr:myosin heavy chain [Vairimorpha ceranae]KKO75396.1 myosin heavy chain [Vairimorpha ceranae]